MEFIKGFAVSLFSSSPGSGIVQRVGDRVYYRGRKQSCYHHAAENNYYDTARSLVLFSGLIPKQLFDSNYIPYLCLEAQSHEEYDKVDCVCIRVCVCIPAVTAQRLQCDEN